MLLGLSNTLPSLKCEAPWYACDLGHLMFWKWCWDLFHTICLDVLVWEKRTTSENYLWSLK